MELQPILHVWIHQDNDLELIRKLSGKLKETKERKPSWQEPIRGKSATRCGNR
jgi:hypothetical protein